jgi:hypothetical protein
MEDMHSEHDLQQPLLSDPPEEVTSGHQSAAVETPDGQDGEEEHSDDLRDQSPHYTSSLLSFCCRLYHATFLPDHEIKVFGRRWVDGPFAVKLLKFLSTSFVSIALVHAIVVEYVSDRDHRLSFTEILVFEGDAIIRDCIVFFLVGRLWQQTGVDSCSWISWMILANVYFELQGYVSWMGHSVTLYEMKCIWPWQLWVFVACVVPLFAVIIFAHIVVAFRRGVVWIKLGELGLCLLIFLGPVVSSPYFHFHHWFAGKIVLGCC